MMANTQKGPLCILQTTQALISLCNCTGWSGPSLLLTESMNTVVYVGEQRIPDQTAQMPTLIWTLAVHIWHKDPFPTLRTIYIKICAVTSENVPLSCAPNMQSDQSLHCPNEETLHPWLSKMCLVKILIRLHEPEGWSESWLSALVCRYVFWCYSPKQSVL